MQMQIYFSITEVLILELIIQLDRRTHVQMLKNNSFAGIDKIYNPRGAINKQVQSYVWLIG